MGGGYSVFRGYRSLGKFHFRSTLKVNFSEAGVAWKGNWDKGHLGSWNLTETLTLMFYYSKLVRKTQRTEIQKVTMKEIMCLIVFVLL